MEVEKFQADDRANIYIFAGIELIGKRENNIWYRKTAKCSRCGKCCMNVPDAWSHGKEGNDCQHLSFHANEYLCDLGFNRPFGCCAGEGDSEYCNIRWEAIE